MSKNLDRASEIAIRAAEELLDSVPNYAYPEKGYSALSSILHALATIEATKAKVAQASTDGGNNEGPDDTTGQKKMDTASLLKVVKGSR